MHIKPKFSVKTITLLALVLFLFLSIVDIPDKYDIFGIKKISLISIGKKMVPEYIYKFLDFSGEKALKQWKNKVFKGKTSYVIEKAGNEHFLHAESNRSASALYYAVSYDINEFPSLGWSWRPIKFPNKKNITDPKLLDDYTLRLLIIFASGFFTNFKCIEYVWDENLKEGTKMTSPFSDSIKQLVIRSGKGDGNWVPEERNIIDDYSALFGEKPKIKVRAIAIMSDSEGSQDSSEADFKEIKIVKKL